MQTQVEHQRQSSGNETADALRRNEFYLSEGQRLAHTGSWALDPAGFFSHWSHELLRMYGLDPGREAPNLEEYLALIHPQDREFMARTIEKMVAEGLGCDLKKRIVRPDGEVRYIRCVGVPVFENGSLKSIVGTAMDITEQEMLTQEMRRRQAYLTEAQRLSHTGSFGWNVVTGERTWSEETYRILGYDPSVKPTFERVRDRVHPDDLQLWLKTFVQASEGKQVDFEHRLLMPDCSVKHLHVVGYGVQKDGKYVELVGTAMDITERKRGEETLRQSEAYLAEAQRLSQTGSWAWSPNPDKDIRYWSEECYRLLGFDPSGPLPRFEEFFQRIHLDDQAGTRERFEKAIHDKADFELDYRIVHPDKGVRDIHVVGHAVLDPSGDLREFVGTVIDITERKRAEEAIRHSEAILAEGQRLSHTGSWGWNASTGKMTWSQEHFRILGLDPQATNPSLDVFWERVHPDDRIGLRRTFESAIRDKRDFEQEFRIVRSDSSIRHLHGVGHAISNKANQLVEFIGTTMDITERKRAEAALQEARAELERVTRVTTMGELAASIAHEVNQPLAGVVTSANAGLNWLANQPPNLLKTREAIERILRDGTRAGEVLTRIRALLKRTAPAKSPVSVNQVIHDVVVLTGGESRQKNVELSLELDSTLPEILGDEIQLQQVFLNLIKNAIEAMENIGDRRKVLLIRSELGELEGKPAILVQISDTGIGFESANTDGLFQAFYSTKPEGMGMGLWISRSIIEAHGGRLSALINDGSGATFQIVLPVNADSVRESGSAAQSHTKVSSIPSSPAC